MEGIIAALKVLPQIAGHPLALVAFVLAIGAYVWAGTRIKTHQSLQKMIAAIPKDQRLKAVEAHLGRVELKEGLSPEQFLRTRVHVYLLWAFMATLATIVVIVALVMKEMSDAKPKVDVTGARLTGEMLLTLMSGSLTSTAQPMAPGAVPPPTQSAVGPNKVEYQYDRIGNKLVLRPTSPLLRDIRAGQRTDGYTFIGPPFAWNYPTLSIKVTNGTSKTWLISEAKLSVRSSKVDIRPVLAIDAPSYGGRFIFTNEGWGRVNKPLLRVSLFGPTCAPSEISAGELKEIRLDSFLDGQSVDIGSVIPAPLKAAASACKDGKPPRGYGWCERDAVCVLGELAYSTDDGSQATYKFRTKVILGPPPPAPPVPPSYTYDVFLEAGRSGYEKRVALSQEIRAGASDQFLLQVGTDRSASFEFDLTISDVAGQTLWSGPVDLEIFVPRSGAGKGVRRTR